MKYCFGTVAWNGYLERYVDIFVNNYITLYRKLINLGVNYEDIPDPKIIYNDDVIGSKVENETKRLKIATGKKLILVHDRHKYTINQIMYATRNRLREEYKKSFPMDKKVFFYFPIDDNVRGNIIKELIKLKQAEKPTACMFKFFVNQGDHNFAAATRPITSYKDIHPGDWGGYCAYNILNENECPLYPETPIPNIAFYADLYEAGYTQYQSEEICIDHLRHGDSHHFKYKNTSMSKDVKDFLMKRKVELYEKGYK